MKKDLIFTPVMLLIGVLLALLDVTGIPAHIGISVVGVMVLGAYTSLTKKTWKIPALEILMRVCYGIALITGVIVNLKAIAVLAIVHKASAALFMVLLVAVFAHKLITGKK